MNEDLAEYTLRMRWCILLIGALIASAVSAQQSPSQIPVSKIVLPDPAYIGMPIWLQVQSPTDYLVRYPSSTTANDFDCYKIEVMRNGVTVPPVIGLPAAGRAGPVCGWLSVAGIADAGAKLPLHLQYPLTETGTYMVRFTRSQLGRDLKMEIGEQSDWVPMHVLHAPPEMVESWLRNTLAKLPHSPGALLGDALPSLLVSRDSRVLQVMIETSYNSNDALARYAADSLQLFDPEQVRPALVSALRRRGSNEALGYLFASRGGLIKPIVPEIIRASLPRLHSTNPAEVASSIQVLNVLRQPYFALSPADLSQISQAVQGELDAVIAQRNEKAASLLAQFLASTPATVGRPMLWKLIDADLATEQSMICVTWYRDKSDLPRLTAILKQKKPSDPDGREHSGVTGDLQPRYGSDARPYLRQLLASSNQIWVRTAAAQGLVQINDRAGWEFFVGVISDRPFYRAAMVQSMVQWLNDIFPALRGSDDATILSYLNSRLAGSIAP
jgi:hypothetical protein